VGSTDVDQAIDVAYEKGYQRGIRERGVWAMAKGDRVEITIQVGDKTEKLIVSASKAGESIEVDRPKIGGTMTVTLVDKNQNPKRTVTLKTDAVLAINELPKGS
jgi:hypothetical protein